jgi:hypothetical protein
VNGGGLDGDSDVALRRFGRGVAGSSGTAKTGWESGAKIDSAASSFDSLGGDVAVFEARLFLFLVTLVGFADVLGVTFLYAAGSGMADAVVVEMRVERRKDIVRRRCWGSMDG